MRVALRFTYSADIAEIPDFIWNDIKNHVNKFDEWLYDESIDHPYWIYKKGKKYAVSFDADAFVNWLNEFVLIDCDKAFIVERDKTYYDEKMPTLYF